MALQTLMAALVGASDTLMLGFLNQGSLSAVSLATQVTFVLSLFTTAVTIGETMSLEIPLTIQWYQGFLLPGAIPDLVLSVMR